MNYNESNIEVDTELNDEPNNKYKRTTFITMITVIACINRNKFNSIILLANVNRITSNVIIQKSKYITSRTAMLQAKVNGILNTYNFYFYYGPNNNHYQFKTNSIVSSSNNIQFLITNLESNTTYFYQIVIDGSNNIVSDWANLTTLQKPNVITISPINITNLSVICRGNITNYGSNYLYYKFTYGLTLLPDQLSTEPLLVQPNGTMTYIFKWVGIHKDTAYQYRILAYEKDDIYIYDGGNYIFVT